MRAFLHHLFLPHHTNNHRPKVLHHQSLLFVIISLLTLSFSLHPIHKEYPSVLGISTNIAISELVKLTNQKRGEKGLKPLHLNDQLSHAAASKAQNMFANNYWAHVAPDGTTPWVFIKNSGYEYLYAGENLARGFTTAPEVVDAWMASPTHRENMLSANYEDIGFAVVPGSLTGSDTILVVEMFGSKYLAVNNAGEASNSAPIAHVLPAQASPESPQPTSGMAVAAIQNSPLIDTKTTTKNISLFILLFFIVVLVVDAIIIERKKIVRVVSHNVDHILFLTILLLAAIIIGKGITL